MKKKELNNDNALSDKDWEALGSVMHGLENLPEEAKKAFGRPKSESPKKQVTIRLDSDLLDMLRGSGAGWQTRANDALRNWAENNL